MRVSPVGSLALKMENVQRTGSFKYAGRIIACVTCLLPEKALGVVAASAGNHAQGVALAARLTGIKATVFMPEFASIAKIQATRKYGAEVVLEGRNFDEAVAAGQARAEETGAPFVSAYDDDGSLPGRERSAWRFWKMFPDLDTILICVGGGGLFSGVATAIWAARPKARIIGVQASGAPNAVQSWKAGHLLPRAEVNTIADGIAIKSPSERTFRYIQQYADDMVTVDDNDIARAMLLLLERAKTVVEPQARRAWRRCWQGKSSRKAKRSSRSPAGMWMPSSWPTSSNGKSFAPNATCTSLPPCRTVPAGWRRCWT